MSRNVVPFRATAFTACGIDWTRQPRSEPERSLREAYLTYESSCGADGLASLLLLATVFRRAGTIAPDLDDAAEVAEIALAAKLRKHQDDALNRVRSHLTEEGPLWS